MCFPRYTQQESVYRLPRCKRFNLGPGPSPASDVHAGRPAQRATRPRDDVRAPYLGRDFSTQLETGDEWNMGPLRSKKEPTKKYQKRKGFNRMVQHWRSPVNRTYRSVAALVGYLRVTTLEAGLQSPIGRFVPELMFGPYGNMRVPS